MLLQNQQPQGEFHSQPCELDSKFSPLLQLHVQKIEFVMLEIIVDYKNVCGSCQTAML